VKYDHNGFRNAADLTSADIAVIGDSMVEGLTVPDAQLTTSLLAQLQGKVVANLGQSAYGPLEELVVLKRYALPLRLQTVVWMFFEGNDLGDVISYQHAMRNRPSFWRSFWTRSFTRSAMKEVELFFHSTAKPSGTLRAGIFQSPDGETRTVYFTYPSQPFDHANLGALADTTRALTEAHALCAAQGARLLVVLAPEKFRVLKPFCQFPAASQCRNWTLNDMPTRLEKAVESIAPDAGYLDLTPYLTESVKRGEMPYYPDDEHWTPAGHKAVAEAINNYLSQTQSH